MAGIKVEEIKMVKITTSDGQEIAKGDALLLQIKDEDIICIFENYNAAGYICTRSVVGGKVVKYRPTSITGCYKVKAFEIDERDIIEAAEGALKEAAAPALAPATA